MEWGGGSPELYIGLGALTLGFAIVVVIILENGAFFGAIYKVSFIFNFSLLL